MTTKDRQDFASGKPGGLSEGHVKKGGVAKKPAVARPAIKPAGQGKPNKT